MDWIRSAWQFTRRVGRRFFLDACSGRAAGLAFSTLFALVPLSAFVVAVLSAFGTFDPLIEEAQQALIQQLVPAVHDQVYSSIQQFASNTRALGFLGFFLFLATAILLLRNINISFNAIWRLRTRRGVWAKIASYTSIIVIGTSLISVSFALGPAVQSVIVAALPNAVRATWFRSYIVPPALFFLAVLFINMLVPAGKVRFTSAALGAGITLVVWEIAKRIFVFWSTSVVRFNLIYGSLAVLPIFLIWLYLTWFFILIGVEVSYNFQHRHESPNEDDDGRDGPVAHIVEDCVGTAMEIALRHHMGLSPVSAEELDYKLGTAAAARVRTSLSCSGLFLDTDHGLLPARGVDTITVGDIVRTVIEGTECSTGENGQDAASRSDAASPADPGGLSIAATKRLLDLARENPAIALTDSRVLEVGRRYYSPGRAAQAQPASQADAQVDSTG